MTRWPLALAAVALALALWPIAWPGMGCHLPGGFSDVAPGPRKPTVCVRP